MRVYQFRHSREGRGIVRARAGSGAAALDSVREPGYSTNMCSLRPTHRDADQEGESHHGDLNLTKRQSEIFEFIKAQIDKTGYPPTVREIGSALGLHSPSTVHAHLAKLERSGVLRRDPTKPRAIEILVDRAKRVMRPAVPLVGQVAAGTPILAEENIEDQLEIPAVIGADDGDYALRVRGDSMRDAGILEDDYVVVHPADDADNGQIVVAMIEDEATVKRFFREGERSPPAAGEPRLRADHHPGRRGPRQGDRRLQKGLIAMRARRPRHRTRQALRHEDPPRRRQRRPAVPRAAQG